MKTKHKVRYVTKDLKTLHDYCMVHNKSVVVRKGQLVGFCNDHFPYNNGDKMEMIFYYIFFIFYTVTRLVK